MDALGKKEKPMYANGLMLPDFDWLNQSATHIKQLTVPLQRVGITMFSHTRIYKDNTFIDVSDRADMLDYFYYQTDMYKHYAPDVNPWAFNNEFFLCNAMPNNPSTQGLRDSIAIDNIIVLIERYETHCELWHFGSEYGKADMTNFYINNLAFLKTFTVHFKEAAKDILAEADNHKIVRPEDLIENFDQIIVPDLNEIEPPTSDFYENLKLNQINFHYKNRNITLSKRESEVLRWLLWGKTSTETGLILNISRRTVEHHLNHVKIKLRCNKLVDIVRVLTEVKLLDAVMHA